MRRTTQDCAHCDECAIDFELFKGLGASRCTHRLSRPVRIHRPSRRTQI